MPSLRAIVSVAFEDRMQCQQPGCGHAVYRRVHVVDDDGIVLLGSTCFATRYGSAEALGRASHGGSGDGRLLTPAERQLLVENTAALIAQFDQQRAERLNKKLAERAVPRHVIPAMPGKEVTPWPWQKPMTSMLYFSMQDGTGWVRVQHQSGQQLIVPWPMFEGWDECLPLFVGSTHPTLEALVVTDVVSAVAYLRQHCTREKLGGHWREIEAEINRE